MLELYKVLPSVKLLTSKIVITKDKSFINILKRNDPEIEPLRDTSNYITPRAIKSIFSFFAFDEKVNPESMKIYFINSITFQFGY